MKRIFAVCLCICVLCALSAPVLAVDLQDYQSVNEDGVVIVDIDGYNAALAAEKVAAAGLDLDVDSFWETDMFGSRYFDTASFNQTFEEAQSAAQETQAPPQVPDDPVESVGADNESSGVVSDVPLVYPAGSYMDAAGNMWSPDGELLSPGTTPAPEGATRPSEEAILVDSDASEDIPVETGTSVYHVVDLRSGAGAAGASDGIVEYSTSSDPVLVGRFGSVAQVYGVGVKNFSFSAQSSVASIEMLDGYSSLTGYFQLGTGVSSVTIDGVDTREFDFTANGQYTVVFHTSEGSSFTCLFNISNLSDAPAPVVDGLKALVVSIFGEYTPVMTTGTVTETVDNVTTTTLVDTVAPGAAGVDYEWCAGVLLFGILLFCLMKLLGGVLK